MSSDISRQRFEPTRDFAAVLMQQGRVLLDADWNEWIEILDHRLRAETMDIVGRAVVPKETPHGFEIGLAGTNLTIGPGRIYVDGILAENHGRPPTEWDAAMAESRGTAPVTYAQQPYLPDSTLLPPPPAGGGPHLVYLDVWRREVTWLEDPKLIESAVGVDSTARWQTVWQVRVLPNVGPGATCASDLAAWEALIRPSAGRLTTGTFNAPADPDPCQVPPTGGYKGLENRLYRIEIHSVDPNTGAARFKWARHNASIATAVREIRGEDLIVDLIGRDAELRFAVGDWVEITDDARELAGLPGIMRKVKDVSDEARIVTIDGALPANTFPLDPNNATNPDRHTRLRRWDQKGLVRDTTGATHHDLNAIELNEARKGAIPVPGPGTSLLLEEGIQIRFSLDAGIVGGRFRAGDYWVFAARVADASVEALNEAPPRGIHHHYCRLAMLTFPGPPSDCRKLWPPDFGHEGCDCSVCVTADSHNRGELTIQQAVDQVRAEGGTVCLGPGIYNLPEAPLNIEEARSVRIRGQGWQTVLARTGPGSAIHVHNSVGVTLERFSLVTARAEDAAADLLLANSADVAAQECYFLQIGEGKAIKPAIGVGGILIHARIQDNVVFGAAGIMNGGEVSNGDDNEDLDELPLLSFGLRFERNQLICSDYGVRLSGVAFHAGETVIADNLVNGALRGGLVATGGVFSNVFAGSRLDVLRNILRAGGDAIVVGVDDARIDGNDLGPESSSRSGHGIVLDTGSLETPLNRIQITNNRIQGVEQDGIHIRADIASGMIKQNQIEGVERGGIVMEPEASAENLVIENNQLLGVAAMTAAASQRAPLLAAIHVVSVRNAEILNNLIRDTGSRAALAEKLAGIQATACGRIRIAGNRIFNLGPPDAPLREADGIAVIGSHDAAEIHDNFVQRSDAMPDDTKDNSTWRAAHIGLETGKVFAMGSARLIRLKSSLALLTDKRGVILPLAGEAAQLRGNFLAAYGSAPAVLIFSGGSVLASDNRVNLRSASLNVPGVVIVASTAIFGGNWVRGSGGDVAAVDLIVSKRPFTLLGNIANGPIRVDGLNLPADSPWKPLNVQNANL